MKKTNKLSQACRVAEYIQQNGKIDRVSALRDVGVANLTAVISDLRKQLGFDSIITTKVPHKNMYGERVYYAEYSFSEDKLCQ